MKHILILSLSLFFVLPLFAQEMEIWRNPPPIVCPHGESLGKHIYIPPPVGWDSYLKNGRIEARSKIEVTYIGFSDSAKVAFQRAIDIWQSLLISPVTIRVRAEWKSLATDVLGSAAPTNFIRNFEGAPRFNTWYPVAIAEKLAGREINRIDEFDLTASFNSSQLGWYYGTDGRTPRNKFDLVYIVLHELGHGLGFTAATADVVNGNGLWFDPSFPNISDIFTQHLEYKLEKKLITQYPNNSTTLANILTSDQVQFNSTLTNRANGGAPAALHAPTPYEQGSSISHFDPKVFGEGATLMNPRAPRGVAVHDPGAVMLAMFADMGWVATLFRHTPRNQPNPELPVSFSARVESDTTLLADSISLVYSTDTFKTSKTVKVPYSATSKEALLNLEALGRGANLQYYFRYQDVIRKYTSPSNAPTRFWAITVGDDVTPPTLTHTPVLAVDENANSLQFIATALDQSGIRSVIVEYQINNVPNTLTLVRSANNPNLYQANLDLRGRVKSGDPFQYRIVATDSAKNANRTILPRTNLYTIKVEGLGAVRSFYTNSFDNIVSSSADFIGSNFFRITQPAGFANAAIHSEHPYPEAGNGGKLNFTYILRYPIKIKEEKSYMEFDEIVLVEPGEAGVTSYLSEDFYDYVIVEGSTDKGLTWKAAIDGYDSRNRPEWLAHYNGQIVGQNSQAEGNPSLFRRRLIDLKKTFGTGNEVIFRFRLYSDPGAAGWGWAIDNLDIQGVATGIEEYLVNADAFQIYPNPSTGRFGIKARFQKNVPTMEIQVMNLLGKEIRKEVFVKNNLQFEHELDLATLPNGIYFVNLRIDNQIITKKLVLQK